MKKCKAFYPIAGSRTAWIPCVRRAEAGSRYCRQHGDAIFGAMLGAIVYEKAVDETVHVEAEKWPRREGKITRRGRKVISDQISAIREQEQDNAPTRSPRCSGRSGVNADEEDTEIRKGKRNPRPRHTIRAWAPGSD
jgi:hypothetical protein